MELVHEISAVSSHMIEMTGERITVRSDVERKPSGTFKMSSISTGAREWFEKRIAEQKIADDLVIDRGCK
ncbi:hypothetical protein KIN20_020406 [Parelaphostrongylus tenuis]|uniref:Uncharacterized protein n=1 Tax=Parelaphostrongylus tenuis TaxID=148309 RepID=A0AAD5QTQ0_PARTN|nr:hypothetical protein KIN20_020406 [Parelaphostrongylus tenuis]